MNDMEYIRMVGGPCEGGTFAVHRGAPEFLVPIRDEFDYWQPQPIPLQPLFRYSVYKICWKLKVGYWWGDK